MKVRDLRAAISGADDDAEVAILNTYDGECYAVDDVSIDGSGYVVIESSLR